MDTKRRTIVRVAGQLFLRNGYHNTTVQDIALACNVSKATIYKMFVAKEDISLAVANMIHEELLDVTEAIQREPLNDQEKLHRIITIFLDEFHHKIKYTDTLIFAFTPEQKERYLPLLFKMRYRFFEEFTKVLAKAFDLASEAQAWEVTLHFSGILREIFFLQPNNQLIIASDIWADYIMDSIAAVVVIRKDKPPLIKQDFLQNFKAYYADGEKISTITSQRAFLFDVLRNDIFQYLPKEKQQRFCEAVQTLEKEYRQLSPDELLIDALCAYLSQQKELMPTINALKELGEKI